MAMTMEVIGEEIDKQWWWISSEWLQMDLVDGGSV
jgi:hypothetical protein